ncbi:hypothetical protein UFOVP445_10 [uncultured Caudovirales phage]|uniref:Uncharacterized protein n=1 Tax=uncultured Caudovirales phage TaxID=2100421 RepID=A0A6J5MER1_9CAUD|nr:hypothetical protein UFOVP445_10 [uncultured Caudovirales phage]
MTFPVFSAGEVLRAQDMNAVGLWLVKSQTIGTGVSSVTVTGAFSADYDNYRIEFANSDATTNGNFMYLALGSANTQYYGSIYFDNFNGASTGATRRNNAGFTEVGVSGLDNNTSFAMDIHSPNLATTTTFHGTYFGGGWSGWFGGQQLSNTQFTAFTISIQAGTFTGGTIRVYGYRN